ncbi:MAG: NAD-dependent protein deacylase [Candidatus Heimdallarchaeota archaeon]|nr:NAD-dependent protein deacylase [Candidatus Heimdallarchaeota archaeon]
MDTIDETIRTIAKLILVAETVIFFTGAGTSVHSGIPDFRSEGGLWEKFDPREVATIRAFRKNPEKVWGFFRTMYEGFQPVKPNASHLAVTEIQQIKGNNKVHIATQNIDGLHQKSGSTNVYELHGNPDLIHCIRCSHEEKMNYEKHIEPEKIPMCPKCDNPLKPKVILFGETLDMDVFNLAMEVAKRSNIAVGIGTSLEVFPAADILLSPSPPTKKALFNLTPTLYNEQLDYYVEGDMIETLPALVGILKEISKR